jgi:hypothetical protein
MSDFKIPPISPLSGSTLINFLKIISHKEVSPAYYHKLFLSSLIILIATPFHCWEWLVFRRRLRKTRTVKAPLFIIGHWRSGTTLLHYALCKDPSAGYLTTYHSLFPNNLASKWLFKTFVKLKIPSKRPSDDMELNADYPQEDGFAFINCQPSAFYNFFYFPSEYKYFYDRGINHKSMSEGEIRSWYKSYDILLRKALIDTKGRRLIVKNPANTARIDKLLKLYPDAKFLYIYRNPVTVFFSTQKFFRNLFPKIWLNPVSNDYIDTMIFDLYHRLMNDYQKHKRLIPEGNLLELRFEDFEKNPCGELKRIYEDLLHENYETLRPVFEAYFESISAYRKNRYKVGKADLDYVLKELKSYMDLYSYSLPADIDT